MVLNGKRISFITAAVESNSSLVLLVPTAHPTPLKRNRASPAGWPAFRPVGLGAAMRYFVLCFGAMASTFGSCGSPPVTRYCLPFTSIVWPTE